MATLPENMLATAELLASARPLGSATLRRAVSTAYYALFSRLAALCALSELLERGVLALRPGK